MRNAVIFIKLMWFSFFEGRKKKKRTKKVYVSKAGSKFRKTHNGNIIRMVESDEDS